MDRHPQMSKDDITRRDGEVSDRDKRQDRHKTPGSDIECLTRDKGRFRPPRSTEAEAKIFGRDVQLLETLASLHPFTPTLAQGPCLCFQAPIYPYTEVQIFPF